MTDEPPKPPDDKPPEVPKPPVLPSPAEAAMNAAIIVSEMVDIDSESGAVIAAAAAAGAAIEAASAARSAAQSQPGMPAIDGSTGDPLTTVKLSRDRIVKALAGEEAGRPGSEPRAVSSASERWRASRGAQAESRRDEEAGRPGSEPRPRHPRARTEPGPAVPLEVQPTGEPPAPSQVYEDFDPVAVATAAIARLRMRAKTDLGQLRMQYQRHDGLVLLIALMLIVIAGRVHAHLVTPPTMTFDQHGLTFEHSTAWLAPEYTPVAAPRMLREAAGGAAPAAPDGKGALYHVELTSTIDAQAKIEVLIDALPKWSNNVMWLELERRTRWGELYRLDHSEVRSISGHDWLRTAYRYAHVVDKNDEPRVDHAIEYATTDHTQIYVVTLFGTPSELERIEEVVAPSLRTQMESGQPFVPQTSRFEPRKLPNGVSIAFDSTVMVIVADLVDGKLRARGGGSGVIAGADGSILTNYHVLADSTGKEPRLHDLFIIARPPHYAALDEAPQLQCAGRPSRSKLQPELDLALIKCDTDLDGRPWNPTSGGVWPILREASQSEVQIGERLWVLGYPDRGGGGLTLTEGQVEGWTGPDGTSGRDYISTRASISSGSSGGPVVDDHGRLVGIASAFRANGKVGLVRPLQTASQLLAYAATGWTPLEGHTEVALTPTAVEAATEGSRLYTTVVDDANEAPIRDATVMVLRPGVNTTTIDLNRLDDQAIAWGRTNAQGEVRLKQLVPPGTYTVMVTAPGYEALIGDNALHLEPNTQPSFDPWGKIGLHSR